MIDPKELRIGNAVDLAGEHFVLTQEQWELLIVFKTFDRLSPIPLTPEILERCGFEYYAWEDFLQQSCMIKADIVLRLVSESVVSVFNLSKCDGRVKQHICVVRYLHQLQNLYFALTGAELNVAL